MIIRWSPQAYADRAAIWDFIASDNPTAAARMDETFSDASSGLVHHPEMGRPGIVTGTRELFPVERYRLVYEVRDSEIWILALVHTSRLWPPAEGR